MDYIDLKHEVEDKVERLADDYYYDMQEHPQDYDWFNTDDEDECWVQAIEKAKEDIENEPMNFIDENIQYQMSEDDWDDFYKILDDICWQTFANKEVRRAFGA